MNVAETQPDHNRAVGQRGESIAAAYLTRLGYRVIDRNWRTRIGEIDIVAEDAGSIVIAEVKTRTTAATGHPFEAITASKLARLRELARSWRLEHPETQRAPIRIDVLGVFLGGGTGEQVVEHVRGVE